MKIAKALILMDSSLLPSEYRAKMPHSFALFSFICVCDAQSPQPFNHISLFPQFYQGPSSPFPLTLHHYPPQELSYPYLTSLETTHNSQNHSDFPINFLFVKLNHHLLGLPSPPSSYILASNLVASSCRTWARYCRRTSASWRSRGGSNIYLQRRWGQILRREQQGRGG